MSWKTLHRLFDPASSFNNNSKKTGPDKGKNVAPNSLSKYVAEIIKPGPLIIWPITFSFFPYCKPISEPPPQKKTNCLLD